jgi:hypothetical protein
MNYNITQLHRNNFKPTFLYIKQHTATGKLYFGKTTKKNIERYTGSGIHWGRHINAHGKDRVVTLWYCLFTDIELLVKTAVAMSEIMNIVGSDDWLNFKPESGLDGGSFAGFNGWAGKRHSEEHKKYIAEKYRGKPRSDQTKEKMALAWTAARKAAHLETMASPERQNIQKKVAREIGKANSQPITLGNITYPSKRIACEELGISHTVLLRRLNGLPDTSPRKIRVPFTEAQKSEMRARRSPRKNITCPHCNKAIDPGNYAKHHGDKCKHLLT